MYALNAYETISLMLAMRQRAYCVEKTMQGLHVNNAYDIILSCPHCTLLSSLYDV